MENTDVIMFYLETVLVFKKLPASHSDLLIELLNHTEDTSKYGHKWSILINKSVKEEISQKLNNMKINTIEKALGDFVNKGLFTRPCKSVYQVNLDIFGEESWEDVIEISASFDFNTGKIKVFKELESQRHAQELLDKENEDRRKSEKESLKLDDRTLDELLAKLDEEYPNPKKANEFAPNENPDKTVNESLLEDDLSDFELKLNL